MKNLRLTLTALMLALPLVGCDTLSGIGNDNSPAPTPLKTIQPQFTPNLRWSKQVGSGTRGLYLKLLASLDDNRLYTADAVGNVFAIDAATGNLVWQQATKLPLSSGPQAEQGLVMLGGSKGEVVVLNEADGSQLWQKVLPNQLLAAPYATQNKVIAKTIDGELFAMNAQTGQTLWTYSHGGPVFILQASSAPQTARDRVIAGFADGKLAAYSLDNGHLLWEQPIAYPFGDVSLAQMVDISGDPVVAQGVIYVATYQGNIAAVNLSNGHIIWQQKISSYAGLSVTSRAVVVSDADSVVWAFDKMSGRPLWRNELLKYRAITAPVPANDKSVVVADGRGYLHWLSLTDGSFIARIAVKQGEAILAPPVVHNQSVYVVTTAGRAAAITTPN